MWGAIAASATLSRSTSSSQSLSLPLSYPHHAHIHTYIYITCSQLRRTSTTKPLSGITQTSPSPLLCFPCAVLSYVYAYECVCMRVCVCVYLDARCCVYAEPTIHSRIRLASTGFVAKAYIHGRNKRQTKMPLPSKNCEENREQFFTTVDPPPLHPLSDLSVECRDVRFIPGIKSAKATVIVESFWFRLVLRWPVYIRLELPYCRSIY